MDKIECFTNAQSNALLRYLSVSVYFLPSFCHSCPSVGDTIHCLPVWPAPCFMAAPVLITRLLQEPWAPNTESWKWPEQVDLSVLQQRSYLIDSGDSAALHPFLCPCPVFTFSLPVSCLLLYNLNAFSSPPLLEKQIEILTSAPLVSSPSLFLRCRGVSFPIVSPA